MTQLPVADDNTRPVVTSAGTASGTEPSMAPVSTLLPGWPIVIALVGLPLWWVLGLSQVIFFLMAVPMAIYLFRLRSVRTPRGFGLWLLLLIWLLAGLMVVQVDAPGAVPGQSATRYLTFFYRMGWYVVATVAMLYVANTRHILQTSRVAGALSYAFLVFVAGGYLGILLPTLEFPSLLELALPGSLRSNQFVFDLVHAQSAQVQDFLGYDSARPSAPFTYTNEWGLNVALTLPFFVAEWWRRGGAWRVAMPILMTVAAVPLVASLNRGLWGAVVLMAVFYAIRIALDGRLRVLATIVAVSVVAVAVVAASPLGDRIEERLTTPHSNEGRGNLGVLSIQSAAEGSPVIGFGTTRDVPGNFNSIAGGDTVNCPRCSPPPLGTQGQLWLLVFASGFGGLFLYCSFFGYQFLRHIRDRDPHSVAALCSLVVLFVTMPVYNAVNVGLFMAAVVVGILARNEIRDEPRNLKSYVAFTWRSGGLLIACVLVGGLGGAATQVAFGSTARATQSVLVPAADLTGVEGARPLTLDSESLIASSEPVLSAVSSATDAGSQQHVEDHLVLSAEPNSRILTITYIDPDETVAEAGAAVAAQEYLLQRQLLIDRASSSLQDRLEARRDDLDVAYAEALESLDTVGGGDDRLEQTLAELQVQSQATVTSLGATDEGSKSAGRTLAEVSVVRTNDTWLVRVGSGLTLGAAAGLILTPTLYRRRRRVGYRPQWRLHRRGLPAVARVSRGLLASDPTAAVSSARRSCAAYLPLAGVLGDRDSEIALKAARHIEAGIIASSDFAGRRVLLVADVDSRFESVADLAASCHRIGLQPVGVIVVR